MLDNELFIKFKATLDHGLAARNPPIIADVMQNFQPTTQGVNIGPTIYFTKGDEKRYGWVQRTDVLSEDGTEYIHTERQNYETPFKVIGSVREAADDTTSLTASDLANTAAAILQSEAGLAELAQGGLTVLRIGQVRTGHFVNGEAQFEVLPNFEIVILHEQVTVTTTPAAVVKSFRVKSV